jgi:hypothetical protein
VRGVHLAVVPRPVRRNGALATPLAGERQWSFLGPARSHSTSGDEQAAGAGGSSSSGSPCGTPASRATTGRSSSSLGASGWTCCSFDDPGARVHSRSFQHQSTYRGRSGGAEQSTEGLTCPARRLWLDRGKDWTIVPRDGTLSPCRGNGDSTSWSAPAPGAVASTPGSAAGSGNNAASRPRRHTRFARRAPSTIGTRTTGRGRARLRSAASSRGSS